MLFLSDQSRQKMNYLGISTDELTTKGAIHTAREISQQPVLWREIAELLSAKQDEVRQFLKSIKFERIILTGAGTSAFIGLSLRGTFQRTFGILTEAISTTDLVSHPNDYFAESVPTLLVSFARSGNSPESVAAVVLADQICHDVHHLIITCNADGKLAQLTTRAKKYMFTLPPHANDQSLAMTSSYSGMLLAGKLISEIYGGVDFIDGVNVISRYAEKTIGFFADQLRDIAELDFKRAVFLGAGPFFGTATEAHLKIQELSDGLVICKNDSFLGFRHGPKAVIDESTLVIYFFSNNSYSLQYEKDLVSSMRKGRKPLAELGISESPVAGVDLEHSFVFDQINSGIDESLMAIASIVPAQLLGFYKSLSLGLKPDAPSSTGAITRVVEGVQIYPFRA
jgi:tagatose-6-phosphate ketose/aldose isomerase